MASRAKAVILLVRVGTLARVNDLVAVSLGHLLLHHGVHLRRRGAMAGSDRWRRDSTSKFRPFAGCTARTFSK